MGGRAAERLVFDDLSAGAAEDLKQATRLARLMVTQCGMSDRVGPVFFRASEEHPFLGREMTELRDHSEHTAQVIDEEVARILREADERAYRLLEEHRDELERLDRGPDRTRGPHRARARGADRQARDRRGRSSRGVPHPQG